MASIHEYYGIFVLVRAGNPASIIDERYAPAAQSISKKVVQSLFNSYPGLSFTCLQVPDRVVTTGVDSTVHTSIHFIVHSYYPYCCGQAGRKLNHRDRRSNDEFV